MNILIIGTPTSELVKLIKKSKYTEKIYTANNNNHTDFPNIEYKNFDELIQKAGALKIDIAINTDKNLIEEKITEAFEKSRINLISVNSKWLKLETSRLAAKKLLEHYKINTMQEITVPLSFPVVIKTNVPCCDYIVHTMDELVFYMEKLEGQKTFLEEYIEGELFNIYAIFDKKNIKYYYMKDFLTEVQNDRLDLLKTKLTFMFSDEHADFIGIFAIHLVWNKNDWHVKDFNMNTIMPEKYLENEDFIYILNSAIYQKLDEE
jgi:phosphoribosylamine-glycine ligase